MVLISLRAVTWTLLQVIVAGYYFVGNQHYNAFATLLLKLAVR
jgi:hypothetical protein